MRSDTGTIRTCEAVDCKAQVTQPETGATKRFCSARCQRRSRDRRLHGHVPQSQRTKTKDQAVARRQAAQRRRSLRAMLQQVEKVAARLNAPCRCDACRSAKARQYRIEVRDSRKGLVLELKGNQCSGCGGSFQNPEDLHFHHLDPKTKRFNLSRGTSWQYSPEEIVAEAKKCIVLCAECHMAVHRGSRAVTALQPELTGVMEGKVGSS